MSETQSYKTVSLTHKEVIALGMAIDTRIEFLKERVKADGDGYYDEQLVDALAARAKLWNAL
jgi:hypothetical protein